MSDLDREEIVAATAIELPLAAPEGGWLYGYVWWCGDPYCDCTKAEILWRNRAWGDASGSWRSTPLEVVTVWEGTFRTDGEPGATTELNRVARRLRRHQHDLYKRIEWPWQREN